MDNEDQPATSHEPRVTDAPESVWLVYGDLESDATHRECCESGEVTWCEDVQFAADVRYMRADLVADRVAAERERCANLCDRAAAAAWIAWDAVADPDCQGRALEAEALAAEIRGPNVPMSWRQQP